MMTPRRRRMIGPALLAAIGVGVMITGIGLHWWRPDRHTEVEWIPQLIGAAIAFTGFYAMDPKGAKDGGGFLVDAGTRIVSIIREGRRATDPVVIAEVPVVEPGVEAVELDEIEVPPLAKIPAKERGDGL